MFSARAGEAEEVRYFEYIGNKNLSKDANNLLRGSYGPYLAFNGYSIPGTIVNIYHNEYFNSSIIDKFKQRYVDKSAYYAISERMIIDNINKFNTNCPN